MSSSSRLPANPRRCRQPWPTTSPATTGRDRLRRPWLGAAWTIDDVLSALDQHPVAGARPHAPSPTPPPTPAAQSETPPAGCCPACGTGPTPTEPPYPATPTEPPPTAPPATPPCAPPAPPRPPNGPPPPFPHRPGPPPPAGPSQRLNFGSCRCQPVRSRVHRVPGSRVHGAAGQEVGHVHAVEAGPTGQAIPGHLRLRPARACRSVLV